ncbi:HTH_48 domain-containing protein [Trichonephila clavipes]|uniref:HTH_48 domain-containing protein n=1 Tax=Trichonephila clavipes TaxID=2585209 RepID=A0A8X6RRL1_TRICX|nr:HTH_48 domain-containing protein [Trichonephila clavipes]
MRKTTNKVDIDDAENDLNTLNIKNWQNVAAYRWNWTKRAVEAAKTCNSRVEQPACIKIAALRGINAIECHSELVKALANNANSYRTVARWVGKFQQGYVSTSNEQRREANADADGIQRLPHCYCVSSRGLHGGSLGPVNDDRSRAMITNFFIPELNNHDAQELWLQQDGARCHTARATIDLLKDTFGDHLISRFGHVNWPPGSCDLTPLDYFL